MGLKKFLISVAIVIAITAGLFVIIGFDDFVDLNVDWQRVEATVTNSVNEPRFTNVSDGRVFIIFETVGITISTYFRADNLRQVPDDNRTENTRGNLSIGNIGNSYYIFYNPDNPNDVRLTTPTISTSFFTAIFFGLIVAFAIFLNRKAIRKINIKPVR
ncbi:MAG: DUF3592 domain-containing protein [Defluviitaleaceae bacterium]|nr:DUF3592 domain-containing protein [Defluviitaleaceae bacterium]